VALERLEKGHKLGLDDNKEEPTEDIIDEIDTKSHYISGYKEPECSSDCLPSYFSLCQRNFRITQYPDRGEYCQSRVKISCQSQLNML